MLVKAFHDGHDLAYFRFTMVRTYKRKTEKQLDFDFESFESMLL